MKAALPVHLGGRMADMAGLAAVAEAHGCFLIEDAAHALGSSHAAFGRVGEGRFSRATTFSFHPVKTIACGEGGLVAVNDAVLAERLRRLRNHGVTRDAELMLDAELSLDQVGAANPWSYEQLELGLNARMTDLEAALGLSQLTKLQRFKQRRRQLAESYDGLLAPFARLIRPVEIPEEESACLHLYQLQMDFRRLGIARAELMRRLHARGIGTQVHYIPVHRQPYFVGRYGRRDLPGADAWYGATLSLPLFPAMQDEDPQRVVAALETCLSADAGAL